jgi:hypothetical protein
MIQTNQVKRLLGRIFPLMALSGLLLAGWGLLITQDDMKSDARVALWGGNTSAQISPDATTALNP